MGWPPNETARCARPECTHLLAWHVVHKSGAGGCHHGNPLIADRPGKIPPFESRVCPCPGWLAA